MTNADTLAALAREPRRCRCHYCGRKARGQFLAFTDGRCRWVCEACAHQQETDAAQEGDASAGPPLHDALAAANWPLGWRGGRRLHVRGDGEYDLARAWKRAARFFWEVPRAGLRGEANSLHAAQAAAEAALRRALRGG